MCDFHPNTCKWNAGLGSFCILKTSFSLLKSSFSNFQRILTNFFTQTFIFPMLFKQCISKNLGRNSFKHYKKVFVEQICIKVLEKRVVKETKSSFAIKFEFQHFWLKSSFPQNTQKISLLCFSRFRKCRFNLSVVVVFNDTIHLNRKTQPMKYLETLPWYNLIGSLSWSRLVL